MINTLDKTLNASAKRKLQNALYNALSETGVTGHLYRDSYWKGVNDVNTVLADALEIHSKKTGVKYDLSIYCKNGGYRKSSDEMSQWKEYIVEIFVLGNDIPSLVGTLNCHAAGTMEDPFAMYDISCVISY